MPALVPVVDSLDKVAEPLRSFYEPKDGKFVLTLEGTPSGFVPAADLTAANAKVVEFRNTNITLSKERDELLPLKTKFEGIDPDAAKAAIAKVTELEKKGVTKPDDLAALINTAVQAAVKPLETEIQNTRNTAAADRKRADESTLRTQVGEKFLKVGGKPKALDYVIAQAASVFEVKDGVVAAKANHYSTAKPGEAITVDEWLTTTAQEHDFAFAPSQGGGANGSGSGNGSSTGLKAGQTLLTNPTPKQLGEHADAIQKGTVKVEYTDAK